MDSHNGFHGDWFPGSILYFDLLKVWLVIKSYNIKRFCMKVTKEIRILQQILSNVIF